MTRNELFLIMHRGAGALNEEMFSATIVVPVLLQRLGCGAGSLGILNSLLSAAWMTQILGAWYFEGKSSKARLLSKACGLGIVPYIAICAALYCHSPETEALASVIVIASITAKTVLSALSNPAMMDMSCQVIDESKRVRLFAIRTLVGDAVSLAGSVLVLVVLGRVAFPSGYALLGVLGAMAAAVACVCLWLVEEKPSAAKANRQSISAFIQSSYDMLRPGSGGREGVVFRRYVFLRQIVVFSRCAYPFAALYAADRFKFDESFVGTFLLSVAAGRVAGGALLSLLSSRMNPHAVMQLGLAFTLVSLTSLTVVPHIGGVVCSFFFQGCFLACVLTADPLLMLEHAPANRKMQGVSLAMLACHPASIVWGLLSGLIVEQCGFGVLSALAAGFAVLAIVLLCNPVSVGKEPDIAY